MVVVNVLIFYYDDTNSNPADFCAINPLKERNKRKRGWVCPKKVKFLYTSTGKYVAIK